MREPACAAGGVRPSAVPPLLQFQLQFQLLSLSLLLLQPLRPVGARGREPSLGLKLHGLGHGLGMGLSPERQGLRPSPSASASASDLDLDLEGGPGGHPWPDRLHANDPTPQDLNATLLRARLGRHFDPRIMSIVRPQRRVRVHKHRYNLLDPTDDAILLDDDEVELDEDVPFRRNRRGRLVPLGTMPASIAGIDFRGVRLGAGAGAGPRDGAGAGARVLLRSRISPRLKRKLQNFLWAYTACPVVRRWRDLGPRFWPRWLKEGRCPGGGGGGGSGDQAGSCSIPPGMRCLPAATRHQALLRWHCRHTLSHSVTFVAMPSTSSAASSATSPSDSPAAAPAPARHCSWIKVEYPVITECSCGCQDGREDHFS